MVSTLAFVGLLVSVGCGERVDPQPSVESPQAARATEALGHAKVFFAHQSVGENIVDGLATLRTESGSQGLKLIDMRTAKDASGGFFAHAKLGTNGDPKGKTDAFVSALEGGLGREVDIAFQKYCFADILADTDVKELFEYYKQGMNRVHQEFPDLRIVHVTAPLVHVQSGPRAVIKRLIGRIPDHYDENLTRGRFNALMRKEYQGREPLFDLAAIEASRPGQTPEPFQFRGSDIYELRPEYTTDGAHLNEAARTRVASELVTFLSGILPATGAPPAAAKDR